MGTPVVLSAVPRLLTFPGALMPAETASRAVTLRNPTRAPVNVRASGAAAARPSHP
jgi:hypothetical protein